MKRVNTCQQLQTRPPRYSTVDSSGNRSITLDVDIMVNNGNRYYCTFRYKAPVYPDLTQGWVTDIQKLVEALYNKYPTLRSRNDVEICLQDAKPVKIIPKYRARRQY